jgi:hypothetical protein
MKKVGLSSILIVAVQLAVGAVTDAQQLRKVPWRTFLMASSPGGDSRVDGFRQGLLELKTAKQIGLTIPQSLLYRADKVIK